MTPPLTLRDVADRLTNNPPQLSDVQKRVQAAVAMILREAAAGLEILFVERATFEDDPWSGNLAFPGGKVEATDVSPQQAAERETDEELGVTLTGAKLLGRLSDIVGESMPIKVSCFVYGIDGDPSFRLSDELSDAFWIPLAMLVDPARQLMTEVHFNGSFYFRPAIRLLPQGRPVLWGLTYRLVQQFLQIVGTASDDPAEPSSPSFPSPQEQKSDSRDGL